MSVDSIGEVAIPWDLVGNKLSASRKCLSLGDLQQTEAQGNHRALHQLGNPRVVGVADSHVTHSGPPDVYKKARQSLALTRIHESLVDTALKRSQSDHGLLMLYCREAPIPEECAEEDAGLYPSPDSTLLAPQPSGQSSTSTSMVSMHSVDTTFAELPSVSGCSFDAPGSRLQSTTAPAAVCILSSQPLQGSASALSLNAMSAAEGAATARSLLDQTAEASSCAPLPAAISAPMASLINPPANSTSLTAIPSRLFDNVPQTTTTSNPSHGLYRRAHTAELHLIPSADDSSDEEREDAARRITAASGFKHHTHHQRTSSWGAAQQSSSALSPRLLDAGEQQTQGDHLGLHDDHELRDRRRQRGGYHLTDGQAAIELFLRLNHARQTLDFARRQAASFAALDKGEMDVWEALGMLNELREYEAALLPASHGLNPDLPLMEHAFQTAELCRLAYPDKDWMHLIGLIHSLGKLLAHKRFGAQPQWAVCGESYPVGCRFDPHIQGSQFFTANPDRRRRQFNTPLGIYQPRCGLKNVFMSWSAAEYLYLMLLLNNTRLPLEALFLVRYQKFLTLTHEGGAYRALLSSEDEAMLPLLASFQKLCAYTRVDIPQEFALQGDAFHEYYQGLINKYIGPEKPLW